MYVILIEAKRNEGSPDIQNTSAIEGILPRLGGSE